MHSSNQALPPEEEPHGHRFNVGPLGFVGVELPSLSLSCSSEVNPVSILIVVSLLAKLLYLFDVRIGSFDGETCSLFD